MKKKILACSLAGLLLSVFAGSSSAALVERMGGKAIYDTNTDLTWLADANYAQTSGYAAVSANGGMAWDVANSWAENLTVDGVSGWRLPTTIALSADPSCTSLAGNYSYTSVYTCTGGELGNLFYNEFSPELVTVTSTWDPTQVLYQYYDALDSNANLQLFSNVKPGAYWTSTMRDPATPGYTECFPDPESLTGTYCQTIPPEEASYWEFAMVGGSQLSSNSSAEYRAWAVMTGDVALVAGGAGGGVNPVPVPAAVWLFGSGLLALLGVSRRRA